MLTNHWRNVLYIGSTVDLKTRLSQHTGRLIAGFTKKYNVCTLLYFEEQPDVAAAEKREKQLKGKTRTKKNAIVESINSRWEDLSSKII